MSKFRLSWGDPVCVRETLSGMYTPKIDISPIQDMGYPPYEGLPELVGILKIMLGYKYVLVTNGTTASLNFVLSALKQKEGREVVITNQHYFPYYPEIIAMSGLQQEIGSFDLKGQEKKIKLIDVPSNPWGNIHNVKDLHNNVVWDSVYANKVYVNTNLSLNIEHRVNVGSLSKMMGLAGLRIGWIATNSESDYELFYKQIQFKSCGVSMISQDLATDILKKVDMDTFLSIAQNKVNLNREEFLKLSSFFDGQVIPVNGMFYPVWIEDKGISILERAGVGYMTLEKKGASTLIRFNLAQNNKLTKDAIKAIKTADRIKK